MQSRDPLTTNLGLVFYAIIIVQILQLFTAQSLPQPNPLLINDLLTGSDKMQEPLGAEMTPFRDVAQSHDRIGFIAQWPQNADAPGGEQIYKRAQNYLSPVVLDPYGKEKLAIVFCATEESALREMQKYQYQWLKKLAPGKGVAIKK